MSQMNRLRLLLGPVLVGAALTSAPVGAQDLPTRVAIDLLYLRDADPEVAKSVKEWADSVDARLETSLRHDESLRLPRQGYVRARAFPRASPFTQQQMDAYWRQRGAIQVAFGRGTRVGGTVRLTANVYLGDLRGSLAPLVPLTHDITPTSAPRATNMILAIAYYALGVDAGSRRGTACSLFARSHHYAKTLPNSVQSAAEVKQALAAKLQAHRCGGGGQ